jgi:ADP-heptose:LPS heptosyltransferase
MLENRNPDTAAGRLSGNGCVNPSSLQFDPASVKRVLIYRLGSLGDTVVALPALHLIERTFPGSRRVLLTNMRTHAHAPAAYAVLEGSGLVHDFMDYPFSTRNAWELAKIWWKVVRFRPQVVIYLMRKRGKHSLVRDKWFFRLCGARRIVGLPVGDLDQPTFDPETGLWEHEAARLLRSIHSLGDIDINDPASWDLRLTPEEEQKGLDALARFGDSPLIACGPGTKMPAKDWGQENWRGLLTRLSVELPSHGLVMIGAEQDAEASDYARAEWQGPMANLCGLTPRETAAILKRVELFLGPDSGQMHLAAAYGIPCAIVYASRIPRGPWFPIGKGHEVVYHTVECSLCNLQVCIEQQKKCITSISVSEMVSAATRAWKQGQEKLTAIPKTRQKGGDQDGPP